MRLLSCLIPKQGLLTIISLLFFFSSCTSTGKDIKHLSREHDPNANPVVKENSQASEFPNEFSYTQFVNANTWFIADSRSLWKSVDSGVNWILSYSPKRDSLMEQYIRGVSFFDEQNGFLIDEGALYKTVDGGANWKKAGVIKVGDEDCLLTNCYSFESCFFYDQMQGWVVGAISTKEHLIKGSEVAYEGVLLKTQDGGITWKKQRLDLPSRHINKTRRWGLNDIFFISEKLGWVVGDNVTFRTVDGGRTWQLGNFIKPQYQGDCLKVNFLDGQFGWIITKDYGSQEFLITIDGGENWEVRKGIQTSAYGAPVNITFLGPDVGFLVEDNLYMTKDGGKNWTKVTPSVCNDFQYIERTRNGIIIAFCSENHATKAFLSIDGITWNTH